MSDKAIYSVDTVETITDNDKIYVNTGDNIKQIKSSDLFSDINSNLVEQGINLFDKTRITNGKGISNSNGDEYPDENVFSTDYIDVLSYKKIVCNRDYGIDNSLFGAFYDDNKSFVSGFLCKSKTIIIPSGVKYVRITFMNKQLDGLCIWNVNSAIGSVANEVSAQNDSLSVIGKCKNLLKPTLQTATFNGITCTNNGDGTYTLNGTATSEAAFYIIDNDNIQIPKGMYKTICSTDDNIKFAYYFSNKGWISDNQFEITQSDILISMWIKVQQDYTCDNVIIKPMITTNLNATYDDFVPYTGDGETLTADVAELKNDLFDYHKTNEQPTYTFKSGVYASGIVFGTIGGLGATVFAFVSTAVDIVTLVDIAGYSANDYITATHDLSNGTITLENKNGYGLELNVLCNN